MSTAEDVERKAARVQAVDEAYERLRTFEVARRRIVLVTNDSKRSGGYGVVQQAKLHSSGWLPTWLASRRYDPPQLIAVKQIKISEVDNMSDAKRAFTKELLVWSGLEAHPGIAKFLGFYANLDRGEAWLLSPWEPYGNVAEFILKQELEVPEKLSLAYDTIDALAFLHGLDPPVCHGDIKSANVLVNSKFRAVLCDFGLARLHEDGGFKRLETSTGFKGSIRWCSPEVLDGQPRAPTSDVYAWAWLVWEIMTGELPYEGAGADYVIIRKIFESPLPQVNGESRLGECLQAWELMTRCWAMDPEQRPTASMCRTTLTHLPRCPPTPDNIDHHVRSAALLENIGDLESWKGNYTEGLSHLEQALRMYEQEGNDKGVASVLRKQTVVYHRHSFPLNALQVAVGALEKFRNLNDPLGTAEILYLMGSSLTIQDNEKEAMPFLKEALEIFRAHGDDVGVVQCLERIGEIHKRDGEYEDASSALENAVEIARRCGDRLGEAKALLVLASMYYYQNENDKGASTISEACDAARRIGWEHGICAALLHSGFHKYCLGLYHEGEELCREGIPIARRSSAWWRLGQGLSYLGLCLEKQDRLDEAADAFEEACSMYHKISVVDVESARSASHLAKIKHKQGKMEESLSWYDRVIADYRSLGQLDEVFDHLEEKAEVLTALERYDEAALYLETALVLGMERWYYYGYVWRKLSSIPKTVMKWELRKPSKLRPTRTPSVNPTSPLQCDLQRLQRRIPQLTTSSLKLPIKTNNS